MSLVVLADAQARSGDAVTQALIDEEEAWLVGRIGPLIGERTETFFLPAKLRGLIDALYLSRRTDSVDTFTSDGTSLVVDTDWRLFDGYIVEKVGDSTASWDDPLVVTYTPNDETIVKGVIYDLLSYRLLPTNIQSIRVGQYSETYGTGAVDPVRANLLGRVKPGAGLGVYASPFRVARHAVDRTIVVAAES